MCGARGGGRRGVGRRGTGHVREEKRKKRREGHRTGPGDELGRGREGDARSRPRGEEEAWAFGPK